MEEEDEESDDEDENSDQDETMNGLFFWQHKNTGFM